MTTTPNVQTAEAMGNVLALTRALNAKDHAAGDLFMPGTHADAVRLLVGAYACLGTLLSDPRLDSSAPREAALMAQLTSKPESRQVIECTLAYLRQGTVLVPNTLHASVAALAAACGLIMILASDQRLNGLDEELNALNAKALSMMQQDKGQQP